MELGTLVKDQPGGFCGEIRSLPPT
jgi:hypothetical protein